MLKTRVLTALALAGGLLLAVFLLSLEAWIWVCGAICALASWEWGALTRQRAASRALISATLPLLFLLIVYQVGPEAADWETSWLPLPAYALSALFWLLLVPLWLRRKWQSQALPFALGTGLVVLVPTALALVHLRALSPWLMLGVMAVVWVADIAAYFAGRRFGRHKLAPTISPGKTWEGAAGAGLAVCVFGLAIHTALALPGSWWLVAVALLIWTALSIFGDLLESLLKRQAGLKDSSGLLPGHGGILDRIDSLTSTLPVVCLVIVVLLR
ncbi:MAG: phosphatidate cytidylyltransferase [Thauera sp.]|jgi:phosphatidate cytidylyltransferase|nr:phosphatidate cytidylyltransferase [Thauera sp.]